MSCCILEGLCYDVFYVLLDYVCVLEGYVMLYFVFSYVMFVLCFVFVPALLSQDLPRLHRSEVSTCNIQK